MRELLPLFILDELEYKGGINNYTLSYRFFYKLFIYASIKFYILFISIRFLYEIN